MARFGKWEVYHKRILAGGIASTLYVKILGCVSLTAYNFFYHFKRAVKHIKFSTVLDAGCGKGDFTFYLAERFPQVHIEGWDLSDPNLHELGDNIKVCNRIRELSGLGNTEFHAKDLRLLDEKNKYDFIFSIHVLEHIENNKIVLKHFYNALKPNGHLHIQMPSNIEMKPFFPKYFFKELSEWEEEEHIGEVYTLDEMKNILENIGFKIIYTRTDGGFLQAFAWQLGEILISSKIFVLYGLFLPILKFLTYVGNLLTDDGKGSLVILAQKAD